LEEIHPDDVVWVPPDEKHWHGAAPTTAMTHISIVEQNPGKAPTWMERVSDEQYRARRYSTSYNLLKEIGEKNGKANTWQ
jgi:hypothetical protein